MLSICTQNKLSPFHKNCKNYKEIMKVLDSVDLNLSL
jgi:hypothetical protein